MSEKTAAEIFKKMAQSENRPEIARLRDIFEDVERALNAKTSHEVVLAGLHELGFKMNINSFRSALQRIRKERGILKSRKKGTTNQEPTQPQTQTPVSSPAPATQKLVKSESGVYQQVEPEPQYITAAERQKAESKKIAEKYSGKTDDESENGIMKFL